MSGALNLMNGLDMLPQQTGRILRRTLGTRTAGRVTSVEADAGAVRGTLFVASDKILRSLPEGERVAGARVFRTSTELCITNETSGQPSDRLRFKQGTFRIVAKADYSESHGMRRYIVAEVRP